MSKRATQEARELALHRRMLKEEADFRSEHDQTKIRMREDYARAFMHQLRQIRRYLESRASGEPTEVPDGLPAAITAFLHANRGQERELLREFRRVVRVKNSTIKLDRGEPAVRQWSRLGQATLEAAAEARDVALGRDPLAPDHRIPLLLKIN